VSNSDTKAPNRDDQSKARPAPSGSASVARESGSHLSESKQRLNGKARSRHKRGWREIEAMRERAELKKMLAEAWDDDLELDDDIFGDSDVLDDYYVHREGSNNELFDDPEGFDESLDDEIDDVDL
jgi:hypothetical protein